MKILSTTAVLMIFISFIINLCEHKYELAFCKFALFLSQAALLVNLMKEDWEKEKLEIETK